MPRRSQPSSTMRHVAEMRFAIAERCSLEEARKRIAMAACAKSEARLRARGWRP